MYINITPSTQVGDSLLTGVLRGSQVLTQPQLDPDPVGGPPVVLRNSALNSSATSDITTVCTWSK